MKRILENCSKRFGYQGWVLIVEGSQRPLDWSLCTTRAELRELQKTLTPDLFSRTSIVKAKINLEVVR